MNPLCVSGYGKIRRTEDAFSTEHHAHAFQDFSHRATRISGILSAMQRCFPLHPVVGGLTAAFVILEKFDDAQGIFWWNIVRRWRTVLGMQVQPDADRHGIVGDGWKFCF